MQSGSGCNQGEAAEADTIGEQQVKRVKRVERVKRVKRVEQVERVKRVKLLVLQNTTCTIHENHAI